MYMFVLIKILLSEFVIEMCFTVKEDSSDSESDYDEDMVLEEEDEDEISDEKTDQDKRTMSSGSSKREDEERDVVPPRMQPQSMRRYPPRR